MKEKNQIKEKNAIIILGGGLTKNLELNEHTKQRYRKAIALMQKKDFDYVICSTDKSYRKLNEIKNTSEARVGKNYLLKKGLSEKNILLEEQSRDTLSNAFYCRKELIDPLQIKSITVVTSRFHFKKTLFAFRIVFPKNKFNLRIISSKNGIVNKEKLRSRQSSEKLVTNFYIKHLKKDYNVKPGDLKSLQTYIEKYNPSYTGIKDHLHTKLTESIKKKIRGKDPLY